MATVAKWEFARNTGHADLKPPKKGTPITMRPHECAMFGEHTFSDEDKIDGVNILIIPVFTALKKGVAVQLVNPSSLPIRDSYKLYSTLYTAPPHFKVSGYTKDEWAIWHEETLAANVSTGSSAAGGYGKIFFPTGAGGFRDATAEQPRANLMLRGGGRKHHGGLFRAIN